jgi:deoxyribodipyrimidine photo-lyase
MNKKEKITVVFLRKDLRIQDNELFFYAEKTKNKILTIFCFQKKIGEMSKLWLKKNILELKKNLFYSLKIFDKDILKILNMIKEKFEIEFIFFQSLYQIEEIKEEEEIKSFCKNFSIKVYSIKNYLLLKDINIKNSKNDIYKVFTAFYNSYKEELFLPKKIFIFNLTKERFVFETFEDELKEDFFEIKNDENKILENWKIGEEGGKKFLEDLNEEKIKYYKEKRDFFNENFLSRLSIYIHFGHVSINQILDKINYIENKNDFIRQLIWRDFSYYTMYHFDDIEKKCIDFSFEKFPYEKNEIFFEKWKNGETGIPMIDSCMKELSDTGYMHNRGRMLVASFLIKNLNIDWRKGQDFFYEKLFDADLANNSFGWQWVAGCGRDASPYFRIFNPYLQMKKFDPNCLYIKKYLKELNNFSVKFLQNLENLKEEEKKYLKNIDQKYLYPIVNIRESSKKALARYKIFKNSKINIF